MAPFTRRPAQGHQQMVTVWIEQPGAYDGEDHAAGEVIFLDERQAWELQRRRKVRICTAAEAEAVSKADLALRPALWPRMHLGMDL